MKPNRIAIWVIVCAFGAAAAIVFFYRIRQWRPRTITLQGAVLCSDTDPRKQVPLAGAAVTVSDGVARATTVSGASGYFKLTFRERVWPGELVTLSFRHPDYKPLDIQLQVGLRSDVRKLYIAAMKPAVLVRTPAAAARPPTVVSNLLIRYTVNHQTETNVGTAVKIFEVVNKGNAPCQRMAPCSPDGLWKASWGSMTLDAGSGNVFQNVRVSCIAGPCPFTRIDSSGFAHGGQTIVASALAWSGTVTFLVEAEVFRSTVASNVRESYPVIYGRDLHFTLPPDAEGVCLEAEVGNTAMVFPLSPNLYMNWAVCSGRSDAEGDKSSVYECELKPGYRF